nr:MAG TPA: hypothetical protein [Caudoviricetes sp.]
MFCGINPPKSKINYCNYYCNINNFKVVLSILCGLCGVLQMQRP